MKSESIYIINKEPRDEDSPRDTDLNTEMTIGRTINISHDENHAK